MKTYIKKFDDNVSIYSSEDGLTNNILDGSVAFKLMMQEVDNGKAVIINYMAPDTSEQDFKTARDAVVMALTVTVDGMVFDANEQSQLRLSTRLSSMSLTDTVKWKLHDNSSKMVTGQQIKSVLRLAGGVTTDLWFS